ncbi:MAG: rod-binding protein [Phyllobacterium sp.]
MAINPPSDLVLDVARAADPDALRASMDRLRSLSAKSAVGSDTFGEVSSFAPQEPAAGPGSTPVADAATPADKAYKKFEAFMLQSFVESMFTSDTKSVFGEGIAGDYWKSMMAEAIANKMADAGGIGIARTLQSDRERKEAASESTTAMLHQIERQLIQQQLEKQAAQKI